MYNQVTRKDIERLIYENNIPMEKNPNWPNLESSGWKWKKYADGTVEAWYRNQHSVAITTAYEDHFRGVVALGFPFSIYDAIPVISVFTSTDGSGWQTWSAGYILANTNPNSGLEVQVYSGSSVTRASAVIAHITGRWK